jgi:hypothetical protein
LQLIRLFFEIWNAEKICQTPSGKLPKLQTVSGEFKKAQRAPAESGIPFRQLSLSELVQARKTVLLRN